MKKRLLKIIIWLMVFIGILGFEAYDDRTKQEAMISVIQFKSTLEKGSPIKKEDVSFHPLPESYYHSGMIKEDHFKEGMFLNTRVYKGGFLLNEQVQEEQVFELAEDERLITVKCSIVQSNAWQSQLFDRVDLLMVQKEVSYTIEDALVYKRYNQQLDSGGLPEYYVFVVKTQDAYFYYEHLKDSDLYIIIK